MQTNAMRTHFVDIPMCSAMPVATPPKMPRSGRRYRRRAGGASVPSTAVMRP